MIQICNWLLTRKCNLSCSYCGIARNKDDKPETYPDLNYYLKNEMSTEYIKDSLLKIKNHNDECFHIFYGGEPFLRKDLHEIINFCNDNNIHYTIISNNTDEIQKHIKNNFLNNVSKIQGFTASIDPLIFDNNISNDIKEKSMAGYNGLIDMKKYCKDVVAEITVMNENKKYLYDLVSKLHDEGINSDITFVDIVKTKYYDFSNIYDESLLVQRDKELEKIFDKIINENLNVHMANTLLPEILNSLPSNLDCEIEKDLHNISIDADGSIRLCLRIKGNTNTYINDIFDQHGFLNPSIETYLAWNKDEYCKGCNWTCMIMSKLINEKGGYEQLLHSVRDL